MGDSTTSVTPKPLTCEECRELLSDYVDRELTATERASVETHLGTCLKCGTESARLAGLKKVVQHWDGVKGSHEFRKVVMDKMIRESQQVPSGQFTDAAAQSAVAAPPEKGFPLVPVLVLAGAVIVAVVLFFVLRGG
jgi:anti-sigma factor RsiW